VETSVLNPNVFLVLSQNNCFYMYDILTSTVQPSQVHNLVEGLPPVLTNEEKTKDLKIVSFSQFRMNDETLTTSLTLFTLIFMS